MILCLKCSSCKYGPTAYRDWLEGQLVRKWRSESPQSSKKNCSRMVTPRYGALICPSGRLDEGSAWFVSTCASSRTCDRVSSGLLSPLESSAFAVRRLATVVIRLDTEVDSFWKDLGYFPSTVLKGANVSFSPWLATVFEAPGQVLGSLSSSSALALLTEWRRGVSIRPLFWKCSVLDLTVAGVLWLPPKPLSPW